MLNILRAKTSAQSVGVGAVVSGRDTKRTPHGTVSRRLVQSLFAPTEGGTLVEKVIRSAPSL